MAKVLNKHEDYHKECVRFALRIQGWDKDGNLTLDDRFEDLDGLIGITKKNVEGGFGSQTIMQKITGEDLVSIFTETPVFKQVVEKIMMIKLAKHITSTVCDIVSADEAELDDDSVNDEDSNG